VTSIKITGGPRAVNRVDGEGADRDVRGANSKPEQREAVQFERDSTSLHQLYKAAQAEVEEISPDRVAEIRRRIADGSYEPDVQLIAQRLLAALSTEE